MSPAHSFSSHDLLRFSPLWGHLLKWPIYFAGGWAAILFRRWRKRRAEMMAQGWPSVEGVIVSGTVKPIPKTKQFHAEIVYSYFVGEYRSGRYVQDFPSEPEADDFVRQIKDRRVQIRYNESNPDRSVLEQSVVAQHAMAVPRFG